MEKVKHWLNRLFGFYYRQGSLKLRGVSFAAATLVFLAAYFLLHGIWGEGITALSILPAVVAGLAFGVGGGFLAGLFLAGLICCSFLRSAIRILTCCCAAVGWPE